MKGLRGVGTGLMACLFALFTAAGVVMFFAGEGAERMAGLLSILLFGFGGAAYVVTKRRDPAGALRVATVSWEGKPVRALVLPVRRAKWLMMLLGQLGMGSALVLMGIYAETFARSGRSPGFLQVIGYGGGAFILFIAAVSLFNLRSGPPRLALFADGVAMIGGMAASYVPWDAIANVGRYDIAVRGMGQRMAGIRATDPGLIRRPASTRVVMVGSRSMSGWDVTYPETMFDLSADELLLLLGSMWQRPELRRVAESLPDGPVPFEQFASTHLTGMAAPPSGAAGTLPA